MSKLIRYNDYIQINPDKRIIALDKSDKILAIDNLLSRIDAGEKGLRITYDLSHSGRKINNRIYSTAGQQKGIDSLTHPYPKPILRNHDQDGDPIGRFIGGEWQDLYDEATQYLQSSQKVLEIHNAFAEDDPMKIYSIMKSFSLIKDKGWPGLGRMRVQANITDEEAIKKFMDGRYLTFSAGSTTDRHVCSICEQDWISDGVCEHRHGQVYDKETCVFITGDFIVLEGSVVNTPADDLSQMVGMEMVDTSDSNSIKDDLNSFSYSREIIMSDSSYELGEANELYNFKLNNNSDSHKDTSILQPVGITARTLSSLDAVSISHNSSSNTISPEGEVNNYSLIEKDASMSKEPNPITEDEVVIEPSLEVTDPTPEDKESDDEDETLDGDTKDIDWNILDLAFQATMAQADGILNMDEREALPELAFCGPERCFPIFDYELAVKAKAFIVGTKMSEEIKNVAIATIDEKIVELGFTAQDETKSLKLELTALKERYDSLEEKFVTVLGFLEANKAIATENDTLLNINCEKNEDTVENTPQDELSLDSESEKIFSPSDKVLTNMNQISSPSEHAKEDASVNKEDAASSLGSFEQKIVKEYKNILSEYGKDAANSYLNSKATYLPRGFNPSNF
jgi:hypothetical protein